MRGCCARDGRNATVCKHEARTSGVRAGRAGDGGSRKEIRTSCLYLRVVDFNIISNLYNIYSQM